MRSPRCVMGRRPRPHLPDAESRCVDRTSGRRTVRVAGLPRRRARDIGAMATSASGPRIGLRRSPGHRTIRVAGLPKRRARDIGAIATSAPGPADRLVPVARSPHHSCGDPLARRRRVCQGDDQLRRALGQGLRAKRLPTRPGAAGRATAGLGRRGSGASAAHAVVSCCGVCERRRCHRPRAERATARGRRQPAVCGRGIHRSGRPHTRPMRAYAPGAWTKVSTPRLRRVKPRDS